MKNISIKAASLTCGLILSNIPVIEAQEKPNIVLFIADDCSYYDIGCYGSPDAKTPHVDKLASEGMLFKRAYQAASVSSPTRHNLYTGLWPMKTGAYPNHTFAQEGTKSIVHHLQPAGYKVALVGKSHVHPESVFPWDLYVRSKKNGDMNFEGLEAFIKECTDNNDPFCVIVASNDPHLPWTKGDPSKFDENKISLPPMYVDIHVTRDNFVKYLAEIEHMDMEFGKVLDTVDKYNLSDKSVVVFTSEQGNAFPFAKWTCYDAGVHTAFIVKWPGVVKPNTQSDAIIEYVDVVPTFLEIAGAKPQGELDGKSFIPVLKGDVTEHKYYTFSEQTTRGISGGSDYYGIRSVADRKYRYIWNLTPNVAFKNNTTATPVFKSWLQKAKTDSHAKEMTTKYQFRPEYELYDYENDPYCMNNLADDPRYKEEIKRLDLELKAWMISCGDYGQETELRASDFLKRGNGN